MRKMLFECDNSFAKYHMVSRAHCDSSFWAKQHDSCLMIKKRSDDIIFISQEICQIISYLELSDDDQICF